MKEILLYPPDGGDAVKPHPSKVEQMKNAGWSEAPANVKSTKEVEEDGES